MKRRLSISLVALLYMSAALVFGALHHHEHTDASGHDDHCAACHWQLEAKTVAPKCPVVMPLLTVTWVRVIIPVSVQAETPFISSTASRAPPVTSA
ncbi:MAG TPA: hypothetical protein VFC78_19670 [Tepidisphaeraceae bacterium]|nr:hypothetical protein [Tepidisphaeraceae bacterium]